MEEKRQPKDIGIKCYCGSSTKYHYDEKMFKCNKTGEWVFFYASHPCIMERQRMI